MKWPTAVTARLDATLSAMLIGVAGVALAIRIVSIAQPLGIDQSLWASAVRAMDRGLLLYADVWEQRPPGIYLTYLAAFRLFGWHAATVAWLDVLAATATTAFLYGATRTLSNRLTAAAAAATFATLTMPAWLYGHSGFLERSVSETFIGACVAAAAFVAARAIREPVRVGRVMLVVGFLVGVAVTFKPNAVLYGPALLAWVVCYIPIRDPQTRWAVRLRWSLLAGVAAAVPSLLLIAWLWHAGLLAEARVAVIDFNRFYVAEGATFQAVVVGFSDRVFLRIKTDPLWFCGAVGAVMAVWSLGRGRRLPPIAGLAVLWGAAAAGVIIVNGVRPFPSYFINALPPLAIMAAWVLTEGGGRTRARHALRVGTLAVMGMFMVEGRYVERVAGWAFADLQRLRGEVATNTYLERFGGYQNAKGYSARANQELATYLAAQTALDDRIFLFGINGAGVYFLADRLPAQRFLRVNFFFPESFPNPRFTLAVTVAELQRAQPRFIVFERLNALSAMGRAADALEGHPEVQRLLEDYVFDSRIEDFTLYRRK